MNLGGVAPTAAERREARPGDALVPDADVVMDRAFTTSGSPDEVWPWIQQLGKGRAGWYWSRTIERMIPRGRRALRTLDDRFQHLVVGEVVPDYGGADASFTVAEVEPGRHLVYTSERGPMRISWSIVLREQPGGSAGRTRVLLRLRLAPVRRKRLANSLGELFDWVTIAGMAAGLRERVAQRRIGGRVGG